MEEIIAFREIGKLTDAYSLPLENTDVWICHWDLDELADQVMALWLEGNLERA